MNDTTSSGRQSTSSSSDEANCHESVPPSGMTNTQPKSGSPPDQAIRLSVTSNSNDTLLEFVAPLASASLSASVPSWTPPSSVFQVSPSLHGTSMTCRPAPSSVGFVTNIVSVAEMMRAPRGIWPARSPKTSSKRSRIWRASSAGGAASTLSVVEMALLWSGVPAWTNVSTVPV